MSLRNVTKLIKGQKTVDGSSIKIIRFPSNDDLKDIDPFLMLYAFDSNNPEEYIKEFPIHPHRGIETITYLIEGKIKHEDSLGNKGTINSGESQWMTAGSGILHEEMPQKASRLNGLQIWLNLSQKEKMAKPEYFDIKSSMIKELGVPQGKIKIISGEYNGVNGVPTKHSQVYMFDIELTHKQKFKIEIPNDHNLFIYIMKGSGIFGKNEIKVTDKTVAIFDEGDELYAYTGKDGVRFMLFAGKPLKEPVALGGSIVMNSEKELTEAFEELDNGTFIK